MIKNAQKYLVATKSNFIHLTKKSHCKMRLFALTAFKTDKRCYLTVTFGERLTTSSFSSIPIPGVSGAWKKPSTGCGS